MDVKVVQDSNSAPIGSKSPISLAANNQGANRPDPAEIRSLAEKMKNASPAPGAPPGPPVNASPPGVGTKVDLYATDKDGSPGKKAPEPMQPLMDLPFLKPLGSELPGQGINTVI